MYPWYRSSYNKDPFHPLAQTSLILRSWLRYTARKQTAVDIYFILFSLACSHTFDGQNIEFLQAKGTHLKFYRSGSSIAYFITSSLYHDNDRACKKVSICILMNGFNQIPLSLRGGSESRRVVKDISATRIGETSFETCPQFEHTVEEDLTSRLLDPAGDLSITAGTLSTLLPNLEALLR
jgi:hypothetical protein